MGKSHFGDDAGRVCTPIPEERLRRLAPRRDLRPSLAEAHAAERGAEVALALKEAAEANRTYLAAEVRRRRTELAGEARELRRRSRVAEPPRLFWRAAGLRLGPNSGAACRRGASSTRPIS
ncbi:unnamed protein product [Prorocentrum cordatum]|uniref:Uncharacterized protein n=1 Tax=Prorocentrum cordatum TaxID=2364126 RepID=A0ABN9VNN1_9DINO|nr:unnamed protein product [Polarella glacialis]